jgi:hypothetical protein
MADTKITITDANGVAQPVDVRTTPDGDGRQVVLLGDGENSGLVTPALDSTLSTAIGAAGTTPPALPAGATGLLGWLRGIYDALKGTLTIGGSVSVSNLPATQPVSAAALPLPTGAATDARLAPATPTNLPGASSAVTSVDGVLMGFSVREAAGTPAAAAMRLRAGSATGTILATVTLAAGESVRDWFGPNGITATGGVYFELVYGTITGGVQTR